MLLLFLLLPLGHTQAFLMLELVNHLLVFPPVLIGLHIADESLVGIIITDGLLSLPLFHVTIDDLEALRLTEINADSHFLVSDLQFNGLAVCDSFLLSSSESDVLDFVHLSKFFLIFNTCQVSGHEGVGLLVQLYKTHLAIITLSEFLSEYSSLTQTIQLGIVQSKAVVNLTMYLIT